RVAGGDALLRLRVALGVGLDPLQAGGADHLVQGLAGGGRGGCGHHDGLRRRGGRLDGRLGRFDRDRRLGRRRYVGRFRLRYRLGCRRRLRAGGFRCFHWSGGFRRGGGRGLLGRGRRRGGRRLGGGRDAGRRGSGGRHGDLGRALRDGRGIGDVGQIGGRGLQGRRRGCGGFSRCRLAGGGIGFLDVLGLAVGAGG